MKFTREQVVAEAVRRYGRAVCTSQMDDAMEEDTLNEAVMTILFDTVYWDSSNGNPFDEEIWAKILPAAAP